MARSTTFIDCLAWLVCLTIAAVLVWGAYLAEERKQQVLNQQLHGPADVEDVPIRGY